VSLRTRRQLLTTAGVAGGAVLAGCATDRLGQNWPQTSETTTDPLSGEGRGWAQFGRTAGHAGFDPDVRVDDPTLDWSVEFSGGFSSPAIVGDWVFLQRGPDPDDDGTGTVLALDSDGVERWQQALPGIGGGFSGCPPTVHRGSVYVGGLDGVYALDARDGSPRWSRETGGSVNQAVLGRSGRVFASTGEKLLALDTRGREGWTYTTGDDRFSSAVPAAGNGYVLYTTQVLGSVVAIRPDNNGDALSKWRYAPGEMSFSTPTVIDGDAYVPGDRLHALSARTGEARWTAPVESTTGVSTDGDRLYLPTENGSLVALDTADGSELWRVSLAPEEGVFLRTRPLVTGRSVVVTTEKPGRDERATTFALDRASGEVRWQRDQPGNVGYDAVAAGDRIYVPVLWDFTLDRQGGGTLVTLSD
jgi:outer membrane protein assembly factor BamB